MTMITAALVECTKTISSAPAAAAAPSSAQKSSAAEAMADILKANPGVQVIGFGEINPFYHYNVKYTVERFADDILPVLARNGIKDLALEAVLTDPQVQKELDAYYRNGQIGPQLNRCLRGYDYNGYLKLFARAKALGIKIHPGGMTWSEAQSTIFLPSYGNTFASYHLAKKAFGYNGKAVLRTVNMIRSYGKKIAFYSGYLHNNTRIDPSAKSWPQSAHAGDLLRRTLGNKYTEVDIFTPYSIKRENQEPYIGLNNWARYQPKNGATLVNTKNNRYIILYP